METTGPSATILLHLVRQPLCLISHLIFRPWFPLIGIDAQKVGSIVGLLRPSHVAADVAFFSIHHAVYSIRATSMVEICLLSRNYVDMDVGNALAGIFAVLNCDVERRCLVNSLYGAANALDCREEVRYLRGCKIIEAGNSSDGRD